MKKKILLVGILQLFLMLGACSSGDDATPTPPVVVVKAAKITSYSKNSGETGETITMYGENFSEKVSDVKLTFDGVTATIVSASSTEIKFTLPQTEKLLPKLGLTIENRNISNNVQNDYEGNIGVMPKHLPNEWFTIENKGLKSEYSVYKMQVFSDKTMYYSTSDYGGSGVYRTLDGGITYKEWARTGFSGIFYATKNDEGWADTSFGIQKVPVGGSAYMNLIEATKGNGYYAVYADSDMNNGTIISQKGNVFTTTNGVDFTKNYEATEGSKVSLIQSTVTDNDHIWAVGVKTTKEAGEYDATQKPFMLFKNNTTDGWKEHVIKDSYFQGREICFTNNSTGYYLTRNYQTQEVKLYKSTNDGDTWQLIYNDEKFTKITFKDANTGWAVLDNKIYKTTNGGIVWALDYTHDQPIRSIAYQNNVVWALSKDKIIKQYL